METKKNVAIVRTRNMVLAEQLVIELFATQLGLHGIGLLHYNMPVVNKTFGYPLDLPMEPSDGNNEPQVVYEPGIIRLTQEEYEKTQDREWRFHPMVIRPPSVEACNVGTNNEPGFALDGGFSKEALFFLPVKQKSVAVDPTILLHESNVVWHKENTRRYLTYTRPRTF